MMARLRAKQTGTPSQSVCEPAWADLMIWAPQMGPATTRLHSHLLLFIIVGPGREPKMLL